MYIISHHRRTSMSTGTQYLVEGTRKPLRWGTYKSEAVVFKNYAKAYYYKKKFGGTVTRI